MAECYQLNINIEEKFMKEDGPREGFNLLRLLNSYWPTDIFFGV